MKKFKGDCEWIFNNNKSENIKRQDIAKEKLISYFGNWWIKQYKYI